MSDELINTIAECEKVSHEIHLPIQSGDNAILKKMNRKYTAAHYKKLVKKIRAKIPDAIISTDIIVGFPGETKKQFANTLKLCHEIKFAKAYIAQYSPRLGTAAYKLKDNVFKKEKKRRWKILDNLINCKMITAKRLDK
jgi:tRNA-2-methylthio-N6-dimethylallyladenosine synthase